MHCLNGVCAPVILSALHFGLFFRAIDGLSQILVPLGNVSEVAVSFDGQLRRPLHRLLKAGLHPLFAVDRKRAGLDPIKSLSVVLDFDHRLVAGLNNSLAVLGDRSVPLVVG
ncbi:hypothetical protein D9M68_809160 [compost metagenome]